MWLFFRLLVSLYGLVYFYIFNVNHLYSGTIVVRPNGIKFSVVINNNGTVEELYKKLDLYIESEISKVEKKKHRRKDKWKKIELQQ